MRLEVHNNRRSPEGKIKELECASESSVTGVGSSPSPPQSMGVLSNSPVRGRGLGEGGLLCPSPRPSPRMSSSLLVQHSLGRGRRCDSSTLRFVPTRVSQRARPSCEYSRCESTKPATKLQLMPDAGSKTSGNVLSLPKYSMRQEIFQKRSCLYLTHRTKVVLG